MSGTGRGRGRPRRITSLSQVSARIDELTERLSGKSSDSRFLDAWPLDLRLRLLDAWSRAIISTGMGKLPYTMQDLPLERVLDFLEPQDCEAIKKLLSAPESEQESLPPYSGRGAAPRKRRSRKTSDTEKGKNEQLRPSGAAPNPDDSEVPEKNLT